MQIIKVQNVFYSYYDGLESKKIPALKDISLDIFKGEFVALIGHNGSGKSTLAKLFNGLLIPDKGSVEAFDMQTTDKARLFDIRKRVGVVFQNPDNQTVATIIEDDLAFGPENIGLDREEIDKRIDWALECVGMTGHRQGTPHRLSGGQKQRLAIAGVLTLKPDVLVLDESTSMLDPKGRADIMKILLELREKQNITIILITHYMDEAALADRIVVINNGEKAYDGGKEIFFYEDRLREYGLELPIAGCIASALRKRGITIEKNILNEVDLAEALCP